MEGSKNFWNGYAERHPKASLYREFHQLCLDRGSRAAGAKGFANHAESKPLCPVFCVDVLSKWVSPIEKNNKIGYNAYWIIQIQTVLFRVAFCAGLFAQERGNYV